MQLVWPLINAVQAVYAAVWTAGWILVALAVAAATRRRRLVLALAHRVWAPGLLRAGAAPLEVLGLDRLDLSRPCLFAANHQSWVDIPALVAALPVPLLFLGKRELARVPFLGWYMETMGMVFVDRRERLEAARSVATAAERLRQGWSLLSFPEGSRTRDGRVQRFKSGGFAAAIEAGVPVVPVVLEGTGRILPRDGFRARPGRIRVVVGEPIPTAGLTRADRSALARRTQERVEDLLERLGQELAGQPAARQAACNLRGA
jgi:1-acyl-sn-glycerol-3-phosphate acyltransferase